VESAGHDGPGSGPMPGFTTQRIWPVAKTSPIEFIREVQAETRKVVWPTQRQTVMTAIMVMIMTSILALFFVGIDTVFDAIVHYLLSLAG
jgi:preprotein translocase subunit SecE